MANGRAIRWTSQLCLVQLSFRRIPLEGLFDIVERFLPYALGGWVLLVISRCRFRIGTFSLSLMVISWFVFGRGRQH